MQYTIQRGDNLTALARRYNTSLSDLLSTNPQITDPNRIYAGASLNVPDAAPSAPVVPMNTGQGSDATKYQDIAKTAGAAGLGVNDLQSLLSNPNDEKNARDEIAREFGYADSDTLMKELFQKPSKTTEQYYNDAYSAAGLDQLMNEISSRKRDLLESEDAINRNPWKTEASRRGEIARLTQLAMADIQNKQGEYDLRHGKVKELLARYADDLGQDEQVRNARFSYLEKTAKTAAEKKALSRLAENLGTYTSAKSDQKPQVVKVGTDAYQYDPITKDWMSVGGSSKTSNTTPASRPTSSNAPVSDAVRYYSELLATGKISVSNVPQSIRNQVVAYSAGNVNARLSDTALKEIQQSEGAIENLKVLRSKIEDNLQYLGPISGFQRLNPYSDARKIQAEVDRVRQQVGKALEGGVLRKEDEEKYKKILATLNDTPETALSKIDSLVEAISRDVTNYKRLQSDTGRYVPEAASSSKVSTADLDYTIHQNAARYRTREELIDALISATRLPKDTVAGRVYTLIPDKK